MWSSAARHSWASTPTRSSPNGGYGGGARRRPDTWRGTVERRRIVRAPIEMSLPLEGIRVVDFCWVLAGPLGTRILSNLGAEVIRIPPSDERAFPDFFAPGRKEPELGAFHNLVDTGKRSWSVDP